QCEQLAWISQLWTITSLFKSLMNTLAGDEEVQERSHRINITGRTERGGVGDRLGRDVPRSAQQSHARRQARVDAGCRVFDQPERSEEQTSALQSRETLECLLL